MCHEKAPIQTGADKRKNIHVLQLLLNSFAGRHQLRWQQRRMQRNPQLVPHQLGGLVEPWIYGPRSAHTQGSRLKLQGLSVCQGQPDLSRQRLLMPFNQHQKPSASSPWREHLQPHPATPRLRSPRPEPKACVLQQQGQRPQ